MTLRVRGIYCLPNGRELVVRDRTSGGEILFYLGGWDHFEHCEYQVNDAGRLIAQGKPTAWDINDLKDTGRTAPDSQT